MYLTRFPVRSLLALLAGAALSFAFAPYHLYWLSYLAPAALCRLNFKQNKSQTMLIGLFFGIGFFGCGVSWIFHAIDYYAHAPLWLSLLISGLFILILSSYFLLQSLVARLLSRDRLSATFYCLVIFPLTWVAFEFVRANFLSGFPWLLLGYSQVDSHLSILAPYISVYGLSWISCFIAGSLALCTIKQVRWTTKLGGLLLAALIYILPAWITAPIHSTNNKTKNVSLVQANVPQTLKWDVQFFLDNLNRYQTLTKTIGNKQLILWPEAAIPINQYQARDILNELSLRLKQKNSALISGITLYQPDNNAYFNAAITLGNGHGRYRKHKLVPFGEFFPFKSLLTWFKPFLDIPFSDVTAGPAAQAPLTAQGIKVGLLICYEIAYAGYTWQQAHAADLLVVLTDDSWFNEIASAQHLQIARLRALETQRDIVFVSNGGPSAFIKPNGKIETQLAYGKSGVLSGKVITRHVITPMVQLAKEETE